MKRRIVVFTVFAVLLSISLSYAMIFVSPKPTRIRLTAAAGKSVSGEIEVSNPTDSPVNMRAYVEDFILNDKGSPAYYPKGTQKYSCSKWVEIYPEVFQMKPKDKVKVRYVVTPPADASGVYYSVIFFESYGEKTQQKGLTVNVVARIGSHITLLIEGTIQRKFSDIVLQIEKKDPKKPLEISYSLDNTGNVDIDLSGDYNILDKQGNFYGRGKYGFSRAMMGKQIKQKAEFLGELPKGKYTLVSTFQIGPDAPKEVIVKETEFEITR